MVRNTFVVDRRRHKRGPYCNPCRPLVLIFTSRSWPAWYYGHDHGNPRTCPLLSVNCGRRACLFLTIHRHHRRHRCHHYWCKLSLKNGFSPKNTSEISKCSKNTFNINLCLILDTGPTRRREKREFSRAGISKGISKFRTTQFF